MAKLIHEPLFAAVARLRIEATVWRSCRLPVIVLAMPIGAGLHSQCVEFDFRQAHEY